MFSIAKKISIVASVVVFCSGQLYASEHAEIGIAKPSQPVFHISWIPKDALELILVKASENIIPANFCLVSKDWKSIIYADNNPNETHLFRKQGLLMQKCMNIWWTETFKTGVLKYKSDNSDELILRLSDLGNVYKDTFDLSKFGNASDRLVITTDIERFFKKGGENKNKLVILIALRQIVEQEINSAAQPFASIMTGWDVAKAPVGIFWQWGNDVPEIFDYLSVSSLKQISAKNLYENWLDIEDDVSRSALREQVLSARTLFSAMIKALASTVVCFESGSVKQNPGYRE